MYYAENYAVGGSYRVNCMGGAIECQVSSFKKAVYQSGSLLQIEIDTAAAWPAFYTQ